jgi:hypothetical protein
MEVHPMRPAPLRPAAAAVAAPAQPQRYLTNDEAAEYLRLSPRTLEKQRVIGGGPKFRKFGRRVMYAVSDLDAWADQRSYEATSDPNTPSATRAITVMAADRWRVGGRRHVQPARASLAARTARPVPRAAGRHGARDSQDLMAFPFFSLAKSRRTAPIDFRAGVTIRVEGTQEHGIATIWDADLLIGPPRRSWRRATRACARRAGYAPRPTRSCASSGAARLSTTTSA